MNKFFVIDCSSDPKIVGVKDGLKTVEVELSEELTKAVRRPKNAPPKDYYEVIKEVYQIEKEYRFKDEAKCTDVLFFYEKLAGFTLAFAPALHDKLIEGKVIDPALSKLIHVKSKTDVHEYYSYREPIISDILYSDSLFCHFFPSDIGLKYYTFHSLEEFRRGDKLARPAILSFKSSSVMVDVFSVKGTALIFVTEKLASILMSGTFTGFELYECKSLVDGTCPRAPEVRIID